jgi:probable rRNA maturation factor
VSIEFLYRVKTFKLEYEEKYIDWLVKVAGEEEFVIDELRYIFVNEKEILKINIDFLGHNYYTDIITFNNNFLNRIKGEIYISVPTVKQNSIKYSKGNFSKEINRVLVHGLLHLLGFDDKSSGEKSLMRRKERFYIKYLE